MGELIGEQREAIRGVVNGSSYKQAPQAKDWVGLAVGYVLGLDMDADSERRRASSITKALVAEGFLVKFEDRDPVQRKMVTFMKCS